MKMWRLMCALALCSALGLSGMACGDDGGDTDPTPDPTPDMNPAPNPDMPDPNPDMPDPNPDPEVECGNNLCEEGETPENCPADCMPPQEVCEEVGAACDEMTGEGNGLLCVTGGDSTNLMDASCHQICEIDLDDADCPTGSFCAELMGEGSTAVCIRSNCTSTFNSEEECAGVGEFGGTCFEVSNDGHYCFAAGEGAEGEGCQALEDCGPGLFCLNDVCQGFCENGSEDECGELLCLPVLNSDVVGVCGEGCSGFGAHEECGEGSACFPLSQDVGICQAAGDTAIDEVCADPNECVPEGLCQRLTDTEDSTCHTVCDRREGNGDQTCPEGEICLDINDVAGVCFDGCTPLVDELENGCPNEGQRTCVAIDSPERGDLFGVCLESGENELGDDCEFIDNSIFGSCRGNLACVAQNQGDESGVCEQQCVTFSSVGDYESGCGENEVCEIFGTNFGVCGDDVANPKLEAFEPCPTSGQWCNDDILCLQADQQGNNICIPLCRLGSDDDCPYELNGGATSCDQALQSDVLGLCIPPN